MRNALLALIVIALATSFGRAVELPVWDLAKDEISAVLQSGKIELADGKIELKNGAAFAVPASAFPDQKNFTVQVVASLSEFVNHTVFTPMNKQREADDGFSFYMNYRDNPYWARQISTVVNKVYMSSMGINGQRGPKLNKPYTFTVAVRDGFATFYIDDRPYKKCYMELIPNDKPMWIGRNVNPKNKSMAAVIHGVKVYGPDHKYVSKKEPKTEFPRGVVAGKGWALDIPKIEHPDWPKILIYGDSISMGYTLPTRTLRTGKANVHRPPTNCGNMTNGLRNVEAWLADGRWDVIHFNFGIHDIKCPKRDGVNQTKIDKYEENLRTLVARLKETGATLVWCSTTQSPKAVCGAPGRDFVAYNAIAKKVMGENKVQINDLYAFSLPRLKDIQIPVNSHFHAEGSKVLASQVAKAVQAALSTRLRR
ncbi:MAG: SGNH/GDSL hydrolase family protein [Victivallales bacterium]|nr:SGNH/GDSL hydrolase family protein [Victivallales bacterium]